MLPTGSAYDRIAGPLLDAVPDDRVVVAGGGSQCIAFAAAAAKRRKSLIVVCPASTLGEHRILLDKYPCEVIATPPEEGLLGAQVRAMALDATLVFGPRCRAAAERLFAETLGAELAASDVPITTVVAPINSGALLAGIGRALPGARLVGTIARSLTTLQDGLTAREHAPDIEAELVEVSDDDAFEMRHRVGRTEGLLVGLASAGALAVAERLGGGVAIAVDAGDRYFSRDFLRSSRSGL